MFRAPFEKINILLDGQTEFVFGKRMKGAEAVFGFDAANQSVASVEAGRGSEDFEELRGLSVMVTKPD